MATARKKVSSREYFKADGAKSIGPAADGKVTYSLLGADGKTAVKAWDFTGNGVGAAQLAMFGFVTKLGNVANSVLNSDEGGTVDEAAAEIDAFLSSLESGVWSEPGGGGARGPKYDMDVLAGALHAFLGANAKGDVAHYRERLNDKDYYAKVRTNAQVLSLYHKAIADRAETPATDEALA